LILRFLPGSPVDLILQDNSFEIDRAILEKKIGINESFFQQYLAYWTAILDLSWGSSFADGENVLSKILRVFPYTLLLSTLSLVFSLFAGVLGGVFIADISNKKIRTFFNLFVLLGASFPIIVKAPILIYVFSILLNILPVSGFSTPWHIVLPCLSMTLSMACYFIRLTEESVQSCKKENFVMTAKAKGLGPSMISFKHVLKNAFFPILAVVGSVYGALLAGTIITESIFNWPGIGRLFYEAFKGRDYSLIQGIVLWLSISYIFITFVVDILYSFFDPRVRLRS